jgi:hypothetical protein
MNTIPTTCEQARRAGMIMIGEWGFAERGGGAIWCRPEDRERVQAAYDAIEDGDLGPTVLDRVRREERPMPKAIYIPPTDVPRLIEVSDYEDISGLVGGHLQALFLDAGTVAYVDEDAKNKAVPPPPNGLASALACEAGAIGPDDYIRGPMLIFGTCDAWGAHDGNEYDASDYWVAKLIPCPTSLAEVKP